MVLGENWQLTMPAPPSSASHAQVDRVDWPPTHTQILVSKNDAI